MQEQDQGVIREFLVETHENLARLDQEIIELEKKPEESRLLASIFRTFHTIKGTCGFLGFAKLEAVTHQAENLLSQLREGHLKVEQGIVSLILETVDAVRRMLASIEATGGDGNEEFDNLMARLEAAAHGTVAPPEQAPQTRSAGECGLRAVDGPAAPALEARATAEEGSRASAAATSTIRVAVNLLDNLMDLVGELVLTRNQILQYNAEREDSALNATTQRLNLITSELQEGVMKTRMQPIGVIWNKLPRMVRDLAVAHGKQIRLEMDGAETELDRTIIEAIKDPLVHLVRNACDHGIETPEVRLRAGKPAEGKLTLRAFHEGGQVNIEISDDGAGIDLARVKQKAVEKGLLRPNQAEALSEREVLHLIFQPGFSTAAAVTSISGRGVGMDVVKSHVEKIGGAVDVSSRSGEGTTVKLKIPLTLAIIPGLVVTSGDGRSAPRGGPSRGERFIIPQVSLLELIRLEGAAGMAQIERIHGTPVYRRRGKLLPLAVLNEVLGLEGRPDSKVCNIVVLQAEDRQFGLVVDGIHDTQEIVVKPLGKQLKGLNVYAGATIMGDGRVALILDVLGIGQRSGVLTESREQVRTAVEQKVQAGGEQQRLLLFRAGPYERVAVPLSLVARLEEFPRSLLETAGGRPVVQYRNRILPLVFPGDVFGSGSCEEADPVQVVVFNDGERRVGVVVDQILDVVEDTPTVRQQTARQGLLGSAVVGQLVTDFLDLSQVIWAARDNWFDGTERAGRRILVAESSAFVRGLIRSSLEMAGYDVVEAANLEEAIRRLDLQPVDAVVAAMDLPPRGLAELPERLRQRPEWERIPVLALADSPEQMEAPDAAVRGVQGRSPKFDRETMLASLERLVSAVAAAGEEACVGERR